LTAIAEVGDSAPGPEFLPGVIPLDDWAAVDATTRSLARKLGPRNIRVSAVDLGVIETERLHAAGIGGTDFQRHMEAQTALGRLGPQEDIAPAVVFAASADSRFITGGTVLSRAPSLRRLRDRGLGRRTFDQVVADEREDRIMAHQLSSLGIHVARYGLVIVLLWIGGMKFTEYEAEGIKPLVENSPLMNWVYGVTSVRSFSAALGVIEIALGVLIALRPLWPIGTASVRAAKPRRCGA
jgi:hypothetical protein